MTGGPAESTLARIDAALTRIEHAVDRVESDREAAARRHAQLRAAVSESLAQLDALLAGRAT